MRQPRCVNVSITLATAGCLLTSALAMTLAQQAPPPPPAPAPPAKPTTSTKVERETVKTVVKDRVVEKVEAKNKVKGKGMVTIQAFTKGGVVVAAAPVGPVPGEPNPQLLQQFRPMLWSEYYITRSVCDLSPEQTKMITRDCEHAFQEAVAKSGVNQQMGIRVRAVRGANTVPRNEPEDSIREGLAAAIKGRLTPEQAVKYQEEQKRLAERRKLVMIDNLVAKLDEVLYLTKDQRDKLRESFKTNWQASWNPSPEMLLFNPQLFPQIPDPVVVPHLNEAQKTIWRGISKYQMGHMRMFGVMGDMVNGNSMEDDALREAREAEIKERENARAKREAEEKKKAESDKVKKIAPAKP